VSGIWCVIATLDDPHAHRYGGMESELKGKDIYRGIQIIILFFRVWKTSVVRGESCVLTGRESVNETLTCLSAASSPPGKFSAKSLAPISCSLHGTDRSAHFQSDSSMIVSWDCHSLNSLGSITPSSFIASTAPRLESIQAARALLSLNRWHHRRAARVVRLGLISEVSVTEISPVAMIASPPHHSAIVELPRILQSPPPAQCWRPLDLAHSRHLSRALGTPDSA
jgi:hypothetical protein